MNKFFETIFVLLTSLMLLSSCTEDPEISTGSISGFVTESKGGTEPISGVTVAILSTGQSTTTGSDGAFVFNNLQPGSYSLQFKKSGYETNTRNVNVVAGSDYKCDVQLSKVEQMAEITIDPSSLNFGTTQVDMNVTIKNNGNATTEWALDLGNNSWLTASQLGGSIQAGRTQSITFTVNRDYLKEPRTVIVNLNANGNSYPIHISCAPRNAVSEMSVDPTNLNFGDNLTEQTVTIRNTGKETLNWSVKELNSAAINLSALQGSVAAGGSSVLVVTLDRSQVSESFLTTFIISDGIKDIPVTVSANTSGVGGGGGTSPADIVLPLGLLAYFPFNGNFNDISGNEVYGYGSPEPTFTDGVVEGAKAISFSKTAGSAFVVNDGLVDSKSMTVSFWAKNISEGDIFYVTSSNKNDGGEEMMSLTYRDGHLKYVVSRYNNHYQFDKTGNFTHKSIEDGKWHHIALVSDYNKLNYSAVTTLLYIDGRIMDTVTEDINYFSEAEPNHAHYGTGTKFIMGGPKTPAMQIANLRVYDAKQLSADEIKTIFEAKQ